MTGEKIATVILAAGKGTRMKSDRPKVLQPLAGRPMISYLRESVQTLAPEKVVIVTAPGGEAVAAAAAPAVAVVQAEPLGTGQAVLAARDALDGFDGDVLILFGDHPLISPATLAGLVAARRAEPEPAVVVLGMRMPAPNEYGRLILGADGALERIVEVGDASPQERALSLCNSGVMVVAGRRLFGFLGKVGRENAKKEYYLTDIVAVARAEGLACAAVEDEDVDELVGVNSRDELAAAERILQGRLRQRAMAAGATLIDPDTVYFSYDTVLGRDVVVEPSVVFGPGVRVGDGARIQAFSHLEGAVVGPGAAVGPFARLRPGTEVGESARVGNFVEVKKAVLEAGAKANHLTYIGDARVGKGANIGAGTITCNYDGFTKSETDIGEGAFIGSNTALVAPVRVGDRAVVGAGSVITKDVEAEALALARAREKHVAGWARRLRERKRAKKGGKGKQGG
ncbi:MAG: bifunctional UDP-N-acetylglucosamine diphosphorylase/glucosamine-1-phosphate N-acetyltransferase GlmU [Alphaproteobacteria bacterium]